MSRFPQTECFRHTRQRPDRAGISDEWIEHVITHAEHEEVQVDGGIRRWGRIFDYENQALRVIF